MDDSVVVDDDDPAMKGRAAILINGRSGNASYDAVTSYHRNDFSSFSEKIHRMENEEIAMMDPTPRQALYWRLVMTENAVTWSQVRSCPRPYENQDNDFVVGQFCQGGEDHGLGIATVPKLSTMDDLFA
eukprot:scaffold1549_cov105-Cylindrotheca_fusiformis.AAC.5